MVLKSSLFKMLYLKEEELKILDLLLIYFSQINARPFNELIAVLILNLSILQRKFPFPKNNSSTNNSKKYDKT